MITFIILTCFALVMLIMGFFEIRIPFITKKDILIEKEKAIRTTSKMSYRIIQQHSNTSNIA